MNTLEETKIKGSNIVLGALFLGIGFTLLSIFSWAWWALFAGGLAAWVIVS